MSRKNLESLLDAMLDEAPTPADDQRPRAAAPSGGPPRDVHEIADLAQLTALATADLAKVIGAAAPDDLLVVIASASDDVQRRILAILSADSVQWIRDNLAHMDHVNAAERDASTRKLLTVANRLLATGAIEPPRAAPSGGEPDPEEQELAQLLTDLVKIARSAGPSALSEALHGIGEPLLSRGLERIGEGVRGPALREALARDRAELETIYARRLRAMEEAVVAISEGEAPEAFRERLIAANNRD